MSREEAIKQLEVYRACMLADWADVEAYNMAIEALEQLTSYEQTINKLTKAISEQEPKTGHWISHREHCEMNNLRPSGLGSYFWCSECDCGIDSKNFSRVNYNYCPNCGAKMRW